MLAFDGTRDVITDFGTGFDLIDLSGFAGLGFADLAMTGSVAGCVDLAYRGDLLIVMGRG